MKNFDSTPALSKISLIIAATIFLLVSPIQGVSQDSPTTRSVRDREVRDANERDLRNRQWNLRMLDTVARADASIIKEQQTSVLVQIKKDFKGLQVSNNDILNAIASSNTLDLKVISEALSEIKQRAARLKLNLVLPESEKDEKTKFDQNQLDIEQLKLSLLSLDRLIVKFIENPIFKNTDVVDAKTSAIARSDLESIIEMSDKIRKDVGKINKVSRQSH
jgi:hypothetical protein